MARSKFLKKTRLGYGDFLCCISFFLISIHTRILIRCVLSGCYITVDWVVNNRKLSFTSLEVAKSKIKLPVDSVSDETHFLVQRWPSFYCNITWKMWDFFLQGH
jgi:hypothetical protein